RDFGVATINDDDGFGTEPHLGVAVMSVPEPDDLSVLMDIRFELNKQAPFKIDGTFRVVGLTATRGVDFTLPVTLSFSIPPGQISALKSIRVKADETAEFDETIRVDLLTLSPRPPQLLPMSGDLHISGSEVGTIYDNDDGGAFGWGRNNAGQLGNGSTVY